MTLTPYSLDAYRLFHEGILAFSDMEMTGIRIDVKYFKEQDAELTTRINDLERGLWRTTEAKEWKKRFGDKTNFDSPTQAAVLLFEHWGHKPTKTTRTGKSSVDDEVLRKIGTPFTLGILAKRKLQKIRDTYIAQYLRYEIDSLIHPSFNLHLVSTYRSSSDSPNFQNNPVRDQELGPLIRRGFLPHRPEDQLGEIDFSGIEVRIAACYHQDPTMISYIEDPTKDMHRDMAAECYKLKLSQVGKKIRYCGKNGFVFPEFYGSYFAQVAPAMWRMVDEHKLTTEDGIPVREHLKAVGLGTLQKFEAHLEKVERGFWGDRFPVYAQWKKDFWNRYLKKGYVELLTGFRCSGPMRRNEVINTPVQGAAFHCTLWSLIQLNRWLRANEMGTEIVGQIHDSILPNFAPGERDIVLRKARKIMCEDIRKHWPWIIVPLDVEAEVAPPGEPWANKKKMEIN